MRHRVSGFKLGRDTEHRTALFRNLAAGVFQHGQITTTLQKAKAVQPFVEKLVTLAKKGDLASRRRAIKLLQDRELVTVVKGGREADEVHDKTLIQKLFDEIGPRYADRPGGYSRIIHLGTHRLGDAGRQVVLQLVGEDDERPKPRATSRRRKAADARTAFAAKARKGGTEEEADVAVATEEPPADESPVEEAVTEEVVEETTEAPVEEAATEEASAEETPAEEEEKKED